MLAVLSFAGVLQLPGQNRFECGFDQLLDETKIAEMETFAPLPERSKTPVQVNAVIHIVYHDPADNLELEVLETVFEQCNRLFRAADIDTNRIHPSHRAALSNTQIQFCLAQVDPAGQATEGITRTYTENLAFPPASFSDTLWQQAIQQDSLGGVQAWNTEQYFNIWIGHIGTLNQNSNTGIPRHEYLPAGPAVGPGAVPGVVLDMSLFANETLEFIAGVLAHECGHALGLFHPWGFPPTCAYDDLIEDTPLCGPGGLSCYPDTEQNTCETLPEDPVDNQSNVMAYACQLMFTPQQADAMYQNLTTVDAGSLLIEENACAEPPSGSLPHMSDTGMEIQLFPNPNSGQFRLRCSEPLSMDAHLRLYDSSGRLVHHRVISPGQQELAFQFHQLPAGLYLFKLDLPDATVIKYLCIQP